MRVNSTETFIQKSLDLHGDLYDYSDSIYVKSKEPVFIKCKIHGVFEQTPNNHLNGKGCYKCSYKVPTTNSFIEKSKNIHKDFYLYNNTVYKSARSYVIITCPIHGDFKQAARDHLAGSGCSLCVSDRMRYDIDTFINKAMGVHGQYSYDNSIYISSDTKLIITCSIHGDFHQTPAAHLHGQGCPTCNTSKGNVIIRNFLMEHDITFIEEMRFEDCRYIKPLPFDFYLPDLDILIEYDGIQHFKAIEYFGGEKGLLEQQRNDDIKNEYCRNTGKVLHRIRYDEDPVLRLKEIL